MPELLRWSYPGLDPELRKAFAVALHGGTALALSLALRQELAAVLRGIGARRLIAVGLELLPPSLAGLLWERPIEERLGSARSVAWCQVAAGLALGAADCRPARRTAQHAGTLDHLLIGVGQALALVPGVSRGGATLTVLRLRRFNRRAASELSRHAALPVILAASSLKGARLARRGLPGGLARAFAAGGLAAFASTTLAARLVPRMDAADTFRPFAVYRVALGALVLGR